MTYSIPETHNRAMLIALLALHVAVLFSLPMLLTQSLLWALVLLPMLWLNIVQWGLIHEAIHKLLLPSSRGNEWGGRALAIAMGTSFHVLRFGHLMHHKLNRHFHSEVVEKRSLGAMVYYYAYLLFGLYLSELVTGFMLTFIPRKQFMVIARATFLSKEEDVAVAGERFFYARGNIAPLKMDMLLVIGLYGAAFAVYGAQWPWLLAFIGIRAFVISFMDNIYHFGTPTDNSKPAKELALAPTLSMLILYGNYHKTHHLHPNVPWRALPALHAQEKRQFDGEFFSHGVKQFVGPDAREHYDSSIAYA